MKRQITEKRRTQMREASLRYYNNHHEKCIADMKAWREKNPDYGMSYYRKNGDQYRATEKALSKTTAYRIRKAAQQRVHTAVKSGKIIKPSICTECGKSDSAIHGHHPDYSKPLAVLWVCKDCHVEIHVTSNKKSS
jgi:hypothetical protein